MKHKCPTYYSADEGLLWVEGSTQDDEQLDTMDREETIRARWWSREPAAGA
jgi:hypothetical protein